MLLQTWEVGKKKHNRKSKTWWKKLLTESPPGETDSRTPCKRIMIHAPFRHCYHHINHWCLLRRLWHRILHRHLLPQSQQRTKKLVHLFYEGLPQSLHEQPLNKAHTSDKALLNKWGFTLTPCEPMLLISMPQFCHIYTETFLQQSLNSKSIMAKVTYFS